MNNQCTKMTLANEYGEYSAASFKADMTIDDTFDLLVIPLLLAAGYTKEIIDGYLTA